jgi:hypothetical protein
MFRSLRSKFGGTSGVPLLGAVIIASEPLAQDKGVARVVFTFKESAREDPVSSPGSSLPSCGLAATGPRTRMKSTSRRS